jgi:hypothetical protein
MTTWISGEDAAAASAKPAGHTAAPPHHLRVTAAIAGDRIGFPFQSDEPSFVAELGNAARTAFAPATTCPARSVGPANARTALVDLRLQRSEGSLGAILGASDRLGDPTTSFDPATRKR